MPCENMFRATVTISKLPVRSPLPNKVPSTRSAPAIKPNSVAATPVPRSLWVCNEITALARFFKCLQNHSIWSACVFGVPASTVSGKFKIIFLWAVAPQAFETASQTSKAYSASVNTKVSGLNSNCQSVSGKASVNWRTNCVPATAISKTFSFDKPKTISRWAGLVGV